MNYNKNYVAALQLCKAGDECVKNNEFLQSLHLYTLALLYSPAVNAFNSTAEKQESMTISTEHLQALLYYNRSLAFFRLKNYKSCVDDIKRAFANGKHDENRCVELLSRLAWCHWHLKEYQKCAEIVEITKIDENKFCKELDLLASLIAKSKVTQGNGQVNSKYCNGITDKLSASNVSSLLRGEHNKLKGVSSCGTWKYCSKRGRYLEANATIKPGSVIVEEEAYAGVLTAEFIHSNCNYCFKECKHRGIPCCGCSKALYCNENCRWLAWQSYHWLECCMGPVLEKLDILAHLALRTVLRAANEFDGEESSDSADWCSFVAEHFRHSLNDTHSKSVGKRKNARKPAKFRPDSKLDGRDPKTGIYSHNYWTIFCLLVHEEKHSKSILTKCTLYANFISKVLGRLPAPHLKKLHTMSSGDHSYTAIDLTTNNLKSAFQRLRLKAYCDDHCDKSASCYDMESFREKALEVCKTMAENAPTAKLKPQSCFYSKDIPRSFQEIIAFLLRRHMLQLQTNCQAVYDVVPENPNSVGGATTVSQRRIASAIFPSTSLLNHSCNANTILNFTGRKLMVRAIRSIVEGNEITHCYGPCMSRHSFKDRQNMLKEQYFFDCSCVTCAKYKAGDFEDQVYMQQFTAYKCSACDSPLLILDSKGPDDATVFAKCANDACKRVHDLTEAQTTYNNIVTASNSASQRLFTNFNDKDLALLESCLSQFEKLLYHHHHTISSLHDQLAYHYSLKKDYRAAAKHVTASLKVTCMRFGSQSVEAAQEQFKLGSLYFNCQMRPEAEKFLNKSLATHRKISTLDQTEVVKAEAMLLALKTYNMSTTTK